MIMRTFYTIRIQRYIYIYKHVYNYIDIANTGVGVCDDLPCWPHIMESDTTRAGGHCRMRRRCNRTQGFDLTPP